MTDRRVLLGLVLLSACSGASDASMEDAISIATLSEELRIDGNEESLVPIQRLLIGPNEEIVLIQGQEGRIRYYDSTGASIGSFGRQGEGPGEFSWPDNVGYVGDTLWVWDSQLSRMTLVSPEQELVRTFTVNRPLGDVPSELAEVVGQSYLYAQGFRSDGALIVRFATAAGISFPEPYENHIVLARISSEGQFEDVVAHVENGGQVALRTGTGGLLLPAPLRNDAFIAVSDDATQIVGVRTSLEGSQADSLSVVLLSHDGEQIWARSLPFEPLPLPQAIVDSVVRRFDEMPLSFQEALQRDLQAPLAYPPLRNLVVGKDGSIWVGLIGTAEGNPYMILSTNGELVGALALPENSRVVAADLNRVWAIEEDEVGVESVVRYGVAWQ